VDSHLIAAMEMSDFLALLLTIGKVAAGLGFVIFIHELGHFLAAKACGVKCEKFYVGFDPPITIFGFPLPKALAKFTWGETEYGIGIIPLGGYVKMLGQDDDPRLASQEAERERIQASKGAEPNPDPVEDAVVRDDADDSIALDPRSFPAKTVPQRILIISAGVIMNLISAVFLAAAAYGLGVTYLPCEFSGTTPGDPAWIAGIEPRDKVIQIGKDAELDEHLRFVWELRQRVAYAGLRGDAKPMDLLIRKPDGEEVWIPVKPSNRMKELRRFGTLGVLAPSSNRIAMAEFSLLDSAAKQATPEFKNGDLIVAVNGVSLDRSSQNAAGELTSEQIESLLYKQFDKPARVLVERSGKDEQTEQIEIVVPAFKYRDTGLRMQMGPIVAMRIGGPAETAGVKVGDVIQAVNGKAVENSVTLNLEYGRLVDQVVTLTVKRPNGADSSSLDIQVKSETPAIWQPAGAVTPGAFHSLETLGLAYAVLNTVADVVVDSPADKAGLKSGDTLTAGKYVSDDKELFAKFTEQSGGESKSFDIGPNKINWVSLDSRFQVFPKAIELSLTYQRGNALGTARVAAVETEKYYGSRNMPFGSFERLHTAQSAGEAMALGWRETHEKFTEVLSFLGLLVQGRISPTNLGGPVRIAQMAGSEASISIARLLLFLTFLSCNLAIINFLPIPALDGGHMVFLIWEGVTGRPPNERVQMTATLVGFVFLLSLMIFVIGNDVLSFF
jgi:regulator of sigma E protease